MEVHFEPWVANLVIIAVTVGSMIGTGVVLVCRFEAGVVLSGFLEAVHRADRQAVTPPPLVMSEQERLHRLAVEANNHRIFVGPYGYP